MYRTWVRVPGRSMGSDQRTALYEPQGFPQNLEFTDWIGWLASLPLESAHLLLPSTRCVLLCWRLLMWLRGSKPRSSGLYLAHWIIDSVWQDFYDEQGFWKHFYFEIISDFQKISKNISKSLHTAFMWIFSNGSIGPHLHACSLYFSSLSPLSHWDTDYTYSVPPSPSTSGAFSKSKDAGVE